ncbi:MAG: type II toxin-antitoxin system VapC family toxin [Rubrivivax sp.]
MIVADVNLLAYLYLPGRFTDPVEALLLKDPDWAVPRLWRSEFNNILAAYMRKGLLPLDDALVIQRQAHIVVAGNEYDIPAAVVLRLAKQSGCSACDCEYVALAEHLDVKLVSGDAKLMKAFPGRSIALEDA